MKTDLGIHVPTGTISVTNGPVNVGHSWWTFQPKLIVSYLKDGWNLTANIFYETNPRSTVTQYKSGDVLHADFTATKRRDKRTVGPVGYYVGQVTDDKSSAFYGNTINTNRYDLWAAGFVGYDFSPASLNVWALNEIKSGASGGTAAAPGLDSASITRDYSVLAQLSFRLWAPDAPVTPQRPLFNK